MIRNLPPLLAWTRTSILVRQLWPISCSLISWSATFPSLSAFPSSTPHPHQPTTSTSASIVFSVLAFSFLCPMPSPSSGFSSGSTTLFPSVCLRLFVVVREDMFHIIWVSLRPSSFSAFSLA